MAPVQNNPGVSNQSVRTDLEQRQAYANQPWLQAPARARAVDPATSEAARQFLQNQAQGLSTIQQGGALRTTQATQASFMAPAAYTARYGSSVSTPTTQQATSAQTQLDGTDFANAFRDKAEMQMVLDEFMNRSPQLKEIQDGVAQGKLPKLLLVFAVMILKQRKQTDDLFEKISGMDPKADGSASVDQQLLMAELTNDIRDYGRLQDTGSNTLKLEHDSLNNTIRDTRSS